MPHGHNPEKLEQETNKPGAVKGPAELETR